MTHMHITHDKICYPSTSPHCKDIPMTYTDAPTIASLVASSATIPPSYVQRQEAYARKTAETSTPKTMLEYL